MLLNNISVLIESIKEVDTIIVDSISCVVKGILVGGSPQSKLLILKSQHLTKF